MDLEIDLFKLKELVARYNALPKGDQLAIKGDAVPIWDEYCDVVDRVVANGLDRRLKPDEDLMPGHRYTDAYAVWIRNYLMKNDRSYRLQHQIGSFLESVLSIFERRR